MQLRVYIAAPYPDRPHMVHLMNRLESEGFEVTSTWLKQGDTLTDEHARVDLADVDRADIVLAVNHERWKDAGTGGRHVEFGYAVAKGKPIVIAGVRSNIFHHLSDVFHVADTGEIEDVLRLAHAKHRVADQITRALLAVEREFRKAEAKHKPMNSPHEGHSVIREELDELWDHVKADTGRTDEAGKEAIQVAAMGLRYFANLVEAQS
jgi:nucleoside 2-deoxyribosyltransferase